MKETDSNHNLKAAVVTEQPGATSLGVVSSAAAPSADLRPAAAPSAAPGGAKAGSQKRALSRRSSWTVSLTVVCFIFGGLLAVQLRAIERVRENREKQVQNTEALSEQANRAQARLKDEEERRKELEASLGNIQRELNSRAALSKANAAKLEGRLRELQMLAGLSEARGPGVVMTVTDNPQAVKAAGGASNPFLPGIVHDFDLLQIVNELRAAKAEAIAINGRRITAYTPIRCVGPTILINFEAATPPFRIQAIGDSKTLEDALNLPGGIVDNLRNPAAGPGLPIRITRESNLRVPASENVPRVQYAQMPAIKPATKPAP